MAKTTNAQYVKMFRTSDFSMVESFAKDFGINEVAALEIAEYVAEKGRKEGLYIRRYSKERNDMPFDRICVYYRDWGYGYCSYTTGRNFTINGGEIIFRTN